MAAKTDRIVQKLEQDNPQLQVEWGTRHIKLLVNGHLIGILPLRLSKEGLAKNSVCQLRRAGLKVLWPPASSRRWSSS